MKRKDLQDLKNKTIAELEKLSSELNVQIRKFQLESKMRKNKNTNLAKIIKKDLARILTVKRQKQLTS